MLNSYHVLFLLIITLAAYLISWFLVKKGVWRLISHRRLWNYILLLSFLISGFLGLLLAIVIEFELPALRYRQFLWLHVETGVVMAITSIFHILWHWRYFYPRRLNNKN